MFDILDRPLHWIPVKWPGLSQGEDENALSTPVEHEIELRVELVDREEAKALFPVLFYDGPRPNEWDVEGIAEFTAKMDELRKSAPAELELFKRLVKGWRKIKAGGRVPDFNDDNIGLLLKVPLFAPSFTEAYLDALRGRTAVREKNSESSPNNGRADEARAATKPNSSEIAGGSA